MPGRYTVSTDTGRTTMLEPHPVAIDVSRDAVPAEYLD